MMKAFKKVLSVSLSAAMLLTTCSFSSFAAASNPLSDSTVIKASDNIKSQTISQILAQKLKNSNGGIKKTSEFQPDQEVNIIVELNGTPLLKQYIAEKKSGRFSMKGRSAQVDSLSSEHQIYRSKIKSMIADTTKALAQSKKSAVPAPCQSLYDYYTVINGFSIRTQYRYLDKIQKISGVKCAFVAPTYKMTAVSSKNSSKGSSIKGSGSATNYLESGESMLDADGAYTAGYKGDHMVIAVLDNGIDWHHDAFSTAPTNPKVTKDSLTPAVLTGLSADSGKLTATDAYKSLKVPFGYDYADHDNDVIPGKGSESGSTHGTHVSGIAAGNCANLKGVAPNAQLYMMKVFSDSSKGAADSDILAGLDDAVKLGADVINMSLGSAGGFSTDARSAEQEAFDNVRSAGINLVVAAGNECDSANNNTTGYNLAPSDDPDTSTVGSPSTYASSLSVASMVSVRQWYQYFMIGNKKYAYEEASTTTAPAFSSIKPSTIKIVDCGIGSDDDFSKVGTAVKGNVALIQRGTTTFTQKVQNAADAGAVAAIVYNKEGDNSFVSMIVGSNKIPAVFVSNTDGKAIKALIKSGTASVKVDTTGVTEINAVSGGEMSDFSSWGVTPDLQLKPEITAPGGGIYSSVVGGGYDNMSGTSMATPHIAGAEALVKGYVENKLGKSGLDAENLANSLLMSTARPAKDEDSNYYSPRRQGAGLADIGAAVTTPAYLSVSGSERPKASLGYNTDGVYSFTCSVNNISGSALNYTPAASVLIEGTDSDGKNTYFTGSSSDLSGKGADVKYDGLNGDGTLAVPANNSATLKVTITLSDSEKADLDKSCPNGTFVDGFVIFHSSDGKSALSLPYVGFYGDWAKAPVFDGEITSFDSKTKAFGGDYLTSGSVPYDAKSGLPLGMNLLSDNTAIDYSKFAISPNSPSYKTMMTQTGLLRDAETLSYTITNSADEVVDKYDYNHISKSVYDDDSSSMTYAESYMATPPYFDGLDKKGKELPDGIYTVTETATVAGTNGASSSDKWSFKVAYDKTAPMITDYSVYSEKGSRYLKVDFEDNNFVSGIQLLDATDTSPVTTITTDPDSEGRSPDGLSLYSKTFDITDATDNVVDLTMTDYAYNLSNIKLALDPLKVSLKGHSKYTSHIPAAFNASVTGGYGKDTFRFTAERNSDSATVATKKYSAGSSFSFTPTSGGSYTVTVYAKDISGIVRTSSMDINVKASKADLKAAISSANTAKKSAVYIKAIPSAQKAFDAALKAAQSVYGKKGATQAQLNASITAVNKQLKAIAGKRAADKTQLAKLITKAKAVDLYKYTDSSASALKKALKNAVSVFNNKELAKSSQSVVDSAVKSLQKALSGLKKI